MFDFLKRKKRRAPATGELPHWAFFFDSPAQLELFEREVVAGFRAHGIDVAIDDGWIRPVDPPGDAPWSSHSWGVTSLGQKCAGAGPQEWSAIIAEHLADLLATTGPHEDTDALTASFDAAAPRLAVRLWDAEALPDPGFQLCARELAPGLVGMLMLDLDRSAQSLQMETVEAWDVPLDDVFDRAIENVWRQEDPPEVVALDVQDDVRLTVVEGHTMYAGVLALMLDRLEPALGAHGALVSVPTRNLCLTLPIDDAGFVKGLAPMLNLTIKLERDGPGSCSARLWWRRPDATFLELPYTLDGTDIGFTPPDEFNRFVASIAEDPA